MTVQKKNKLEGNVRSLKGCLKSYKIIPFSGGPVKIFREFDIIKGSEMMMMKIRKRVMKYF